MLLFSICSLTLLRLSFNIQHVHSLECADLFRRLLFFALSSIIYFLTFGLCPSFFVSSKFHPFFGSPCGLHLSFSFCFISQSFGGLVRTAARKIKMC